jgi:hypothetical protein
VSNSIDGRAIGRVINDWNTSYPVTRLRIDAVTRDDKTVYSAQLGFGDGSDAEFDLTEDSLRAPALFPQVIARRGPTKYTQGQWILFDELAYGAFKIVTERMGGDWATDHSTRKRMTTLTGYVAKKA